MLDQYKQKELERINKLVADYQSDIDALNQQAKEVDEKYRKLAEQEKSDIVSTLDYLLALMEDFKAKVLLLSGEAVAPEKKTRRSRKTAAPEEQNTETVVTAETSAPAEEKEEALSVVDTLFPENNVEEPAEPVAETAAEEDDLPWDDNTPVAPEENTEVKITDGIQEDADWTLLKEWEN